MSAGGIEYTFYFAWVPHGTTPWDPSLARFDENVFDLLIEHDEGQIPQATVEVKNPRIGLINPSRSYWAWISYSWEACPPHPLFLGRLVGIPTQIMYNTIKMQFIARAPDYIVQKQHMARQLKVLPNYDPIFFDVAKRDDPDAILEGWSALYHVDRINNLVSASDILVGEDGSVDFATQDVFYDSVQMKLLQSPLVAVNVKAEIKWEQQYRGQFYVGQWAWPTLGGDPFVGDWPKSGSSLGGGWYAGASWAGERDPSIALETLLNRSPQVQTINYSWTNQQKTHQFGDTMSVNLSYTPPWGTVDPYSRDVVIRSFQQIGIQNPYAVDGSGNPEPINIPAKIEIEWFSYRTFQLYFLGKQSLASLGLIYMADRKRSERLEMTVKADVQHILIDPLITEDTEQITLKSGDLSLPQINLLNWSSVAGQPVSAGQFIFPDNPLVPGQTSSQICVTPGTAGMTEPIFSNIAGQTTADGSVVWSSLGDTPPSEGAQDWVQLAFVPLGALLIPKPISGVPDLTSTMIPGALNYPPTGTAVPRYAIFCAANSGPGDTMYEVTDPGLLGGLGPQATMITFTNPSGMFMYICTTAGQTGEFHTTFNESTGATTTDGSVVWQNLGPVNLPIGGWPGMTPASTYFPTDRGQDSLKHMFCRARAKLRKRARAVEISFDTRFESAAQLSCRMNGKITDPRLPGTHVSGKVISYKLEAHGDSGEVIGRVVIGCSIGNEALALRMDEPALLLSGPSVPSYVTDPGYVLPGYQQYYSIASGAPPPVPGTGIPPSQGVPFSNPATPPNWPILPPTLPPLTCPPLSSAWSHGPTDPGGDQMSYTPPTPNSNDDGLTFPVTSSDVIIRNQWHGIPSTMNPANIALFNLQLQQIVNDAVAQNNVPTPISIPGAGGVTVTSTPTAVLTAPWYQINLTVQQAVLKDLLKGTSLWYELVLKPLTNGPFSTYYVVDTSHLLIPQTINLSAASS